jgi:predicted nucleotide-binding protein (sugar kinase/HSP70/actin superfamily)
MLHQIRPYEKTKGITEEVYKRLLSDVSKAIENGENGIVKVLEDSVNKMLNIERNTTKKPIIGIVGEIYVRSNAFSNSNVIRTVEALGGQVWLAPICEWISYVNFISNHSENGRGLNFKDKLGMALTNYIQHKDEHMLEQVFLKHLHYGKEPKVDAILEKASPYIHVSFEGEAILSVGKSVDFIEKGVSGIINVMPFTCMPGTISSAIMRLLQKKYDVPIINIAYDGQGLTNINTRLEAFMYQVREYFKVQNG